MAGDYGPVPISRLKDEASRMANALKEGRRVLISRQGRVVAQIEPASAARHTGVLASFAVDAESAPRAVSPTLLSKGAGSEAVHAVENGEVQLLTRNSKVLGVITSFVPAGDWDTLMERERAMEVVEKAFPNVNAEQFERVVDSYSQPERPQRSSASAGPVDVEVSSAGGVAPSVMAMASGGTAALLGAAVPGGVAASAIAFGAVGAITAFRRAQLARATALRALGEQEAAEKALREVVDSLKAEPASADDGLVVRSYLALADLYNDSHRPAEALDSAEQALERLGVVTASAST